MTRDRLKIAFVIDELGYGGAQRQLSILAEGVSEFVDPHVFCLSTVSHPFAARIRERQIPVVEIERRSNVDFRRLRALYKTLAREQIDVVHGILDAANIYAFLAARKTGLPVVLSLRSDRLRLGGIRAHVLRYALRNADRVVANSKAGRHYLTANVKVSPEKILLIPNAVSSPAAPDPGKRDLSPGLDVIGFVGRLSPEKRIDMLVDAFAILLQDHPEAHLVLVGDGTERARLTALIQEKGLGNSVEMTGMIEGVAAQMARFSCLVLPSVYEGSPNVVLEALAGGVPVIASPVGDLEEIVVDGHTGFLLRERTAPALAHLLDQVLRDDSLRQRVSVEGPRIIREKFSVGSAVEKLCQVYWTLAAGE